jgi:hypothetical protein
MAFNYHWENGEANFGAPIPDQVSGGTHITFEIIPQFEERLIAVRRPAGIPGHELPPGASEHPKGMLYFCHGLIRRGESIEDFLTRVVGEQLGVRLADYRILDIESEFQDKDGQWAFMPYVSVTLASLPSLSPAVTEVVTFTHENVPDDFGWWTKDELQDFLTTHEL